MVRYPLHGKIANTPAHRLDVSIDSESGEIAVRGVTDEARLFGCKLRMTTTIRTQLGSTALSITDEVTNLSAETADMELLYHINFGTPLLSPGARLLFPVKKVAPRDAIAATNITEWDVCGPETPGMAETCFYFELLSKDGQSQALLRAADGRRGVSVHFGAEQLPRFTLWKNRPAAADSYVVGLEPATSYPNTKSFEKQQGRVVPLRSGETRRFRGQHRSPS